MDDFFKQRVQLHQKHMQRYLRYVFNDHFALIMMFLVGGLGFYYSNWLKTLPLPFHWGKIILLILWYAALHIGQFVSLAKPADQVFLLPKEKQMRQYLSKAFYYSCLFPSAILVLVVGATMPLVVVSTGRSFGTFFFFLITLTALKYSHLTIKRMSLFQDMQKAAFNAYLLWAIISVICLSVSLYLHPITGMLLALLQISLFTILGWRKLFVPLDWQYMIAVEQQRLHRIYQFINLFTDVPEISSKIKRRAYLDPLFKKITYKQENTYFYLFTRRMLRGSEFSGLYLRLVSMGAFLLYFVSERWFALGLGCLFIYLIGFQLLPLYQQFRYMIMTQLYPIKASQKKVALQKLLGILLTMTVLIFAVITLFSLPTWSDRLLVSSGYLLMDLFFVYIYLPKRLDKLEN